MQRKRRWIWLGVALAVVIAVVIAVALRGDPQITVVEVERQDVVEVYVTSGELEARQASSVSVEVPGQLAEVHVAAGDRVAKDEVLVELRPLDVQLEIALAKAQLAIQQADLERVSKGATNAQLRSARAELTSARADERAAEQELVRVKARRNKGLATGAELESAEANATKAEAAAKKAQASLGELKNLPDDEAVAVAEARVERARSELARIEAELEKTQILAPFDGLVLGIDAAAGEHVAPGQSLVRIAALSSLEITTEIDEAWFARVTPGTGARCALPSLPDQPFRAVVRQVGPEVDARRGLVDVHLVADTLPERVLPGLTVDVAFEVQTIADAIAVPTRAVVRDDDDRAQVMIVEADGTVRATEVEILAVGETHVAIDGVELGARVAADATLVADGDQVEAVSP